MGILEWALLGALMLLALAISARVMRKGVSTLDDNRKQWLENMAATDRQLDEDRRNMSAREHLVIIRAAVEDLLRLDGFPQGWEVRQEGRKIQLQNPSGLWTIELSMREKGVGNAGKVLHGRPRWLLAGPEVEEEHVEPASLMRSLDDHLHARAHKNDVPEHLARRMRHLPQEPH